jgi:serine/threonine protein kinase
VARSGSDALAPGDTIAGYRVEAQLGEGAMGCVFRAVRLADQQVVALKVVREDLAQDETHRRRFVHEARAAAEIDHPNLVAVIDAGETEGRQYLAMRYLDGVPLERHIEERGVLPIAEVVRLASEMGGALAALHAAGLVHRDVKASNILIGADGTFALTDFGLARGAGYSALTKPGSIVGTLDYLAPERIRGDEGTPAGDVYALGCVVFEALIGRTPFGGRGMLQVGFGHLGEPPPDPAEERADVPDAFGKAVLRALEKAPDDRPAADEYAAALRAAAGEG